MLSALINYERLGSSTAVTTLPPDSTIGAATAAGVGERRQLAELANCFGVSIRGWLAFHGASPEQAQAWSATFFHEVEPGQLALPGSGGGRLRRIVFRVLESWAESHVELPREGDPDLGRQHFYARWGRSIAAAARGCYRDELAAGPEATLLPLIDPLLAGPLRAATVEAISTALQMGRGPALARTYYQRLRFGEVVRSLVASTVGDPFEIEGEIHELSRLVESDADKSLDGAGTAPGCRSCQRFLLPDVAGLVCPLCLLRAGQTAAIESARLSAAEADAPAAGDQFSHYELLEEIGRGGMGVIHRARDRRTGALVAVKLLQPGLAASPELRERFRREARAMESLDHPNILPVYQVGERGALPFFAMKLVDGGSLIEGVASFSGKHRQAVAVVAQVARAVHHAHERGLLHRDLKPANVLLDRDGVPYVTDFGLARWIDDPGGLTRSLVVLGTAGYVAPEQAEGSGNAISPRADVYSLGVLLFELLTATRPFSGDNALSVLRQAAVEPAPSARRRCSDVPRALDAICQRALQPNPAARYARAADFAQDLEDWLGGRTVRGARTPWLLRAGDFLRRHPRKLAVLAGAVLAGFGWWLGTPAPPSSAGRWTHPTNPEAGNFVREGVRERDRPGGGAENLRNSLTYFRRALDLEPDFAVAHAELSRAHSQLFWHDIDRTPLRARLARKAADRALELAPSLARALLAQAEYWFRCERQDERAMEFLRRAHQADADDLDAVGLTVMVAKRVHRWEEAIEAAKLLCRIKPRESACQYDLGVTYEVLRRYDEAEAAFERAHYLAPDKEHYIANLGWIRFRRDGQTNWLGRYLAILNPERRMSEGNFGTLFAWHALERKWSELLPYAESLPENFVLRDSTTWWPREFILAQILLGQGQNANEQLRLAERRLRARVEARPEDGRAQSALGRVLALQGAFEEAEQRARRGAALVPVTTEPVNGPDRLVDLAEVLLRAGKIEEGRELVGQLLREPGYLTRHDLRLDPRWDFARETLSEFAR
ncbi:MAG: protein kinase [Verrucomicrobia bacterium]|nr:protein kinase [Verrucomicrobiota bacterium]